MNNAGLFPGQGSQQVGMGKSFYEEFAVFRQTLEEASDAINVDLKKLCFEGPEDDLTLTENAQPAILAVSTGCYRVAHSTLGINTTVNLGHSLGEYSALVASHAIPFADTVTWVRQRGLAMQKAVPIGEGSMCAIIGAENHQVEDWCKTATQNALNQRSNQTDTSLPGYAVNCTVEPANFNAPGQIVVSGSVDALSELETLISNLGIKGVMAKRLNVSAPFHSSLMNAARAAMETIFEKANKNGKLNAMTVPYIPNRTARLLQDSGLVFELLSEQMDHSVLWSQSIETLFQMNVTKAYEFGPGKVLQGLAKRIAKKSGATFEVTAIYDLETLKQAEANQS